MKRGFGIFVFLGLILILSLTFVSAGLFSDIWNKITGKATDVVLKENGAICSSDSECKSGACDYDIFTDNYVEGRINTGSSAKYCHSNVSKCLFYAGTLEENDVGCTRCAGWVNNGTWVSFLDTCAAGSEWGNYVDCTGSTPYCDSSNADDFCSFNCVECGGDGHCSDSTKPYCVYNECSAGTCVPSCVDKQCGDDGCGGSCGTCSSGYTCDLSGKCNLLGANDCVFENPKDLAGNLILISKYYYGTNYLQYAGKYCQVAKHCAGFDSSSVVVKDDAVKACRCDSWWGCKGGTCVENVALDSQWERVGSVICKDCPEGACGSECIPNCVGKECGEDGCEGICGTCSAPKSKCNSAHICVACLANSDCGSGKACVNNACVENESENGVLVNSISENAEVIFSLVNGEEKSPPLKPGEFYFFSKEGILVDYSLFNYSTNKVDFNVFNPSFEPFDRGESLNNLFVKGFFGYVPSFFDSESSFSNPDIVRLCSGFSPLSDVEWADFPSSLDSEIFYVLNLPNWPDRTLSGYELFYDFFLPKNLFESIYPQTPYVYIVSDESPWREIPYENVEKIYNFYDQYDPQATTWINFAWADKQGDLERYKQNIKLYGDRADVVSFDYYPSFNGAGGSFDQTYSVLDHYGIDAIGDFVEIFKDVFGENKEMWFISQAYGEKSRDYEILKRDLKFMPYQAIVHGVDGIIFFGLHVRGWYSLTAFPEIVHPIMNELEYLEEYLTSSPTKQVLAPLDKNFNLIDGFDGIEYSVFRNDEKFAIIAVNRKDQNVEKVFNSDNLGVEMSKMKNLFRFYYSPSSNDSSLGGTKVIKNQDFNSERLVIDFSPYEVYILEGEMEESKILSIPVGENKKNMLNYDDKEVFLISDKSWEDVLPLVPLTTWTGNENCNEGYGTAENVCVYPTLIYHEEESGFDVDSIIYFMQQYNAERVTIIGETPQELDNLLITQPELGAGVSQNNIKRISPSNYINYWSSYQDVVYVQDDYELALLASTYASLIDAPLIIKGTSLDVDENFAGRNVICVGYDWEIFGFPDRRGTESRRTTNGTTTTYSGLNRNCNEKYTLEQLQQKYVGETNTDKIILVNPDDLDINVDNGYNFGSIYPEKSMSFISDIYGRTSLVAPILASAKHEIIFSTKQPVPFNPRDRPSTLTMPTESEIEISHIFNLIVSRISALGMNAKYLTIIAAPNAIEDKVFVDVSVYSSDIYLSLDQYLYTTDDHLYVGRIMGLTPSDVSGYISRDLFYNSLPNTNFVLLMASSRNIDVNNAIYWAHEFIDSDYLVEIKTSLDVAYGFDPELWKKHIYHLISYQDHGGSSWLGISSWRIPQLNSAFVVGDACSTVSTYDSLSFWAHVIRKGGIGYVGAIGVGFTTTVPMYRDTINGIYYDDYSIGQALGESYQDNVFNNFDIFNMDLLDKYKFMTTLIGDPTLNINPPYKLDNLLK
ncbi:MAG: hypothetical protein ABIE36_02655 [Candidatus Diapherotrites archaeon]